MNNCKADVLSALGTLANELRCEQKAPRDSENERSILADRKARDAKRGKVWGGVAAPGLAHQPEWDNGAVILHLGRTRYVIRASFECVEGLARNLNRLPTRMFAHSDGFTLARDRRPLAGPDPALAIANSPAPAPEPARADTFAAAMAATISDRVTAKRRVKGTTLGIYSPEDEARREASKAELRALAEASGMMAPAAKAKPAPAPAPVSAAEPYDWRRPRIGPPIGGYGPATPPVPEPAPVPPAPAPDDLAARRSAAARLAQANRDRFAAARKAADTRRANRAPPPPPAFVDWVSERIGTRRWAVAPVQRRERALFDRIINPDWYRELRTAYAAATA